MKLINDQLFLEFSEMVEAGVSEKYLWKAKSTGTKCWEFINDPSDRRRVLIGYERLRDQYKEMVQARYGNPYDLLAKQPIRDLVTNSPEAHDFFLKYRYNDNLHLPIQTVHKYTRADAWLSMLGKMSLQDIKKGFGLSIPEFYTHVSDLVKLEIKQGKDPKYDGIYQLSGDFPYSYRRLREKAIAYREQAYADLIDPMFGNKNSAKIGRYEGGYCPEIEAKQMAVIRATAAKHNNFDAAQVERFVNVIFEKNGWETLSRSRIYQILQENKALLTPGRRGRRAYNSEIAMQVKRTAPKFPTYYFTLDGWTVELLYQDKNSYDNRLVMVVVLDAMNKYPVGYAIGDRENTDLIREANRNAIMHLKDLFGDYYQPRQLQSDHYGIKQLTPFYQAMGHLYVPAAVGNAKSKIIEPYFKYLNKEYCQRMPNWSGFNITANRENQVNTEFLNMIKHSFPDRAGVVKQVEMIIATERAKKGAEYVRKWQEMPETEKLIMSQMDRLMVFGVPMGKTNAITGQGLVKQIDGVTFTYDCFDPAFRQHLHIDWQLIIDPQDMSQALAVSPDGKLRFVLHEKVAIPMDLHSTTEEHNTYRSRVRQFNQERMKEIIDQYGSDAETAREVVNNTPLRLDDPEEAALKLMLTYGGQQKERIQDAKRLKAAQAKEQKTIAAEQKQEVTNWKAMQQQYMSQKTDFNQYLD